MSKKDNYQQDLTTLLDRFFEAGSVERLKDYIAVNSNLPGPRGNLELAAAFGQKIAEYAQDDPQKLWQLCADMASIPASEAPVNSPRELIPFCGVIGIGALGSVCPEFYNEALAMLKNLANDPRWRMREAAPMALQKLLAKRGQETLRELDHWTQGSWLEMRAAAAAVADPPLLKNKEIAWSALQLHYKIFERVQRLTTGRKIEDFKALKKGLAYTLSVVVCAVPQEGFELMAQLVSSTDGDILWIVRENLKKNRLVKNFPTKIQAIQKLGK
jgi:hypothetical protein